MTSHWGGMMGGGMMGGGFGALWMGLLWLLLIGGLVALAVAVLRRPQAGQQPTAGPRDSVPAPAPSTPADAAASAQAILDERLARGDLDVQDYSERSRALRDR